MNCYLEPNIYLLHLIILIMSLALLSSYLQLLSTSQDLAAISDDGEPRFLAPIPNLTVAVGRDAQLTCLVSSLGPYKAAWLRVEDKGILTIHQHVISRNYRLSLITHENRSFVLVIKNVQESDRGGYMCQINTVPMKSQVGFLDVLVPPRFEPSNQSWDQMVTEGYNVTLTCYTQGNPSPSVKWRREDNSEIIFQDHNKKYSVRSIAGDSLTILRVTRIHMGVYLCIASNGVPPAISRRIQLHVNFAPTIWIGNRIVKGSVGSSIILNCHIEAFPITEKYWTKGVDNIRLPESSSKYLIKSIDKLYKSTFQLKISSLEQDDYDDYRCYARNNLGFHEGVITLNETDEPEDDSDELMDNKIDSTRGELSSNSIDSHQTISGRKFKETRSRDKKRGIKDSNGQQLDNNVNPLQVTFVVPMLMIIVKII
ncbi:lachesin-like [Tetranychus urticae]|uniref:lachesin-like n=1 Tax=Tetranychus urticae TaxID=32264 RepID=UPI00077B9FE6|nr:lachesin-like [Tetranychus urticae]